MGGKVVEAAVPAHDAAKRGGFEGELADLDRIGAAEFDGELASQNGQRFRLHQHGADRDAFGTPKLELSFLHK